MGIAAGGTGVWRSVTPGRELRIRRWMSSGEVILISCGTFRMRSSTPILALTARKNCELRKYWSSVTVPPHMNRSRTSNGTATNLDGMTHPSGFRLERIEIEVKGKTVERLAGQVAIGQRLGGINGVLRRIVLRIDLVGHDPLRQRPRKFRSKRDRQS